MEGIVAKRRDSRYETGKRSDAWIKIKATHSEEFVVGGYTVGSGARADTFGSLVVGYYKAGADQPHVRRSRWLGLRRPHAQSRCYARLQAVAYGRVARSTGEVPQFGMWRRPGKADGPITWVKPDLVAQVKFAEKTSDGILRAPVFLGLRDDKAAREVVAVDVVSPPRAAGTVRPPKRRCDRSKRRTSSSAARPHGGEAHGRASRGTRSLSAISTRSSGQRLVSSARSPSAT